MEYGLFEINDFQCFNHSRTRFALLSAVTGTQTFFVQNIVFIIKKIIHIVFIFPIKINKWFNDSCDLALFKNHQFTTSLLLC